MIWKRLFGRSDTVIERHGDSVIEYTPKKGSPPPPQSMPEWTPVNALEEQMALIPHSVDAQFAFARLLLESDVLFATADTASDEGKRTLQHDEEFQILCVEDTRGGTAAALFTSANKLAEAFGEEAPYVALNGRIALETVAEQGVMINPGGTGIWTFYDTPTIKRILSGNI